MIIIAFFDGDGTLLKFGNKELSEKTRKALLALQRNHVLICMATGRSNPLVPHFQGVEFDVLLTFNGSYVRAGEEVLFKNPLDAKDKQRILQK